ncbi:bifunctional proline dehydrogenase/L-glutamate gamma-semialdehyde dehydrogenase [Curtobacterium flaccumfaciens]|uniref:bifunctional proline dehydrogenase/L-glutamate gamma-semialdehyde dehydrogenase n=1 Tax=Curtobacterium flaccumfaciens TaxID=2035 RepID=UPI001367600B|nr:bifunctional proline dehydrogenase/L-glutamate gamma-semialdehyde dehydrogenase [Curtobacterium flaccumfaciens]MBT1664860.1 proline dehydrogenase family protein [Curtobacterium flaccumfaciens pv. flaccumfaciens]QHN62814.1 bifunctional proline dehydrogenase/L-glutamate gamma-semialdehyde dehydrogenase [Curtobacterium flaccumfaciens pv. flaccumfaciens]
MPSARLQDTTDDAVALVHRWLAASAGVKPDPGAVRLAEVLRDEQGLDFTRGFVDKVIRPEDPRVAARNLEQLSRDVPDFLAWYLRGAVTLGGGFATMAPWAVIPTARRILRRMTGHLVIDASTSKLGPALAKVRGPGTRLNVNLLGEAVLGSAESDRRLQGTMDLLARDDVDHVSIKVSAVVPQTSPWAFDQTVERVVDRLVPLYRLAAAPTAAGRPAKFINLDIEEYRDLDVTLAVFRALLDRDEFADLPAGIVLQAYLPDAAGALDALTAWAQERRARGGAPITVRLVKGANLAMEHVDAILHGWPLATWGSKRETDTAYLRLLDAALTPERTDAVRIGVAGHNLFDLATAWVLAQRRGVTDAVDVEMLLGMASTHAQAVRADVGQILLYTPVVQPDEFDSAIAYLARRLQESASPENFIAAASDIDHDASVFEREHSRFLASVAALDEPVPATHRTQDRHRALGEPVLRDAFRNAPDTDPSIAANRAWALDVLRRVPRSQLGAQTIRGAKVADRSKLERIMARTAQAGVNWGRQDPSDRAELLDLIGHELETRRADLIEVMAAETGTTFAEADAEVTEAVDAAHYYAESARRLGDIEGAQYVPPRLTVVVPPWSSPVAIPAGGVLAALAAGSGVVLKPAPEAKRSGAVLADVLWDAGVPHSLLQLVDLAEDELGRDLIGHPTVDRIILTGSSDTARSFRWWRAGLPLTAGTSGKNAIVVTPSADLDLAVQDIVQSAFGHAGQQCSAASLVILVGSVGESERFQRQLVDATRTLRVAWPDDPTAQVGPLIAEPQGALRQGLTELGPGESWLVQPEAVDDSGRLWSPGIRDGVRPGSDFHQTEYSGPVLGIMRAETLEQAIAIQNGTDFGLTAGIHSLDVDEVSEWLARVRAGNLSVNRGITGAVVGRQPFGGWKGSSVGTGTKAGGPMYVATLGRWLPTPRTVHKSIQLHGLPPRVTAVIEAARSGLSFEEFDRVRAGALSDVHARETLFRSRDLSGLVVQRNVLRHRPQSVIVRQAEDASTVDLVRTLVAATSARAHVLLSTARPLPGPLTQLLAGNRSPLDVVDHLVESDQEFHARASSGAVFQADWSTGQDDQPVDALEAVLSQGQDRPAHTAFGGPGARIRLLGGDPLALEEALGASIDVAIHDAPVVEAGVIEMLPYLREQSVSITAHRFGDVDSDFSELRV